jgi:hypothetical protein
MEKYGTYVVFVKKNEFGTKVYIPLHEEDTIKEFEKDAEWEYEQEETRKEVQPRQ